MPTSNPWPSPPPVSFQQQVWLKNMQEALARSNVPQATIDQATREQQQHILCEGYVTRVATTSGVTTVIMVGQIVVGPPLPGLGFGEFTFDFPPNDSKYLSEFLRAMNHPHLRINLSFDSVDSRILGMEVLLDYDIGPIGGKGGYQPPFDVREIKTGT